MEIVYDRCAGLDVHKQTVVACRIVPRPSGGWEQQVRTFGTMSEDLQQLATWLTEGGVTQVALESTGVYWQPIYNWLEDTFQVMLVNARHIKQVTGRKTDVKDAQWIAELLQHGLLKASFIPERAQRELRDLIRYRTHLVQERSREVNRVQKVLEQANIKLGSVATDVLGVSGRAMIEALIAGQQDAAVLAQFAKARLRNKIDQLQRALQGRIQDIHRLMLRLHLEHIDDLDALLVGLDKEIQQRIPTFDVDDLLARLDEITGVGTHVAQILVAEVGIDMSRFVNANHLASWASLAPGKNESAGRNRSARVPPGNQYLRAALVEAAHAAGRSKKPFDNQ